MHSRCRNKTASDEKNALQTMKNTKTLKKAKNKIQASENYENKKENKKF